MIFCQQTFESTGTKYFNQNLKLSAHYKHSQ